MVSQSALYPIEIPDFYLTFGVVFKRAWGHDWKFSTAYHP